MSSKHSLASCTMRILCKSDDTILPWNRHYIIFFRFPVIEESTPEMTLSIFQWLAYLPYPRPCLICKIVGAMSVIFTYFALVSLGLIVDQSESPWGITDTNIIPYTHSQIQLARRPSVYAVHSEKDLKFWNFSEFINKFFFEKLEFWNDTTILQQDYRIIFPMS